MWRKTRTPNEDSPCVGTDPNRNWDCQWGSKLILNNLYFIISTYFEDHSLSVQAGAQPIISEIT